MSAFGGPFTTGFNVGPFKFADPLSEQYRQVGMQFCNFVQYAHWMQTCFPSPVPSGFAFPYKTEEAANQAGIAQSIYDGKAVGCPQGSSGYGANIGNACLTYGDGTAYWRDLLNTANN